MYSFSVNTIKIFISCNENIQIFTRASHLWKYWCFHFTWWQYLWYSQQKNKYPLYILLQTFNNINASLQKLLTGNQYTNKTRSKKGHNSAKIWQMTTNIELDLYFSDIKLCKVWMKSMHPLQKLLSGNEQQKLSWKRAITQQKFGEWLPISKLTCIL